MMHHTLEQKSVNIKSLITREKRGLPIHFGEIYELNAYHFFAHGSFWFLILSFFDVVAFFKNRLS